MKDIFFQELRNRVEEIREIEKKGISGESYQISEKGMILINTIHLLEELANAARKYGLLELEERAGKAESTPGGRYLKQFICLVVDGIDPELLEEMAELRYYTAPINSYSALQYMIMVKGILEIQQGTNPVVIREILLCMLPEEMSDAYLAMEIEKQKELAKSEEKTENNIDLSIVEKVCGESENSIRPEDNCYYIVRMLEELFRSVSDRGIQRMLRDVHNQDLCLALKGMSGDVRKIVFNNLSARLAVMIAEDMEMMGPVRLSDVGDACNKLLAIFLKLISQYEIVCDEELITRELAGVFVSKFEKGSDPEVKESESRLHKLWSEYKEHSSRWIGE